MRNNLKKSLLLGSLCFSLILGGCGKDHASEENETKEIKQDTVMLAAAASLETCFTEDLKPLFEKEHPGITVEGIYDASGKLQTQIAEGLDADVFFSAAEKPVTTLIEQGYITEGDELPLLENKLVLISRKDSETEVKGFSDIGKADMIAIGEPDSVPAGQYAKEALESLHVWDEIQDKISYGTNVTQVLNWVAAGSAEVGVVYATDAAINDQVEIIETAKEEWLSQGVYYYLAPVKASREQEAVKEFMTFLQSEEAGAIMEQYGFTCNQEAADETD